VNDTPTARAPVTDALKAALKDEINFDIRTRANKIPESVVDQIIDILAARGLLSIAHPPAAERGAPGGVVVPASLLEEVASELEVAARGEYPEHLCAQYPSQQARYDQSMDLPRRVRAALLATPAEGGGT